MWWRPIFDLLFITEIMGPEEQSLELIRNIKSLAQPFLSSEFHMPCNSTILLYEGRDKVPFTLFAQIWCEPNETIRAHSHPLPSSFCVLRGTFVHTEYVDERSSSMPGLGMAASMNGGRVASVSRMSPGDVFIDVDCDRVHSMTCVNPPCILLLGEASPSLEEALECHKETTNFTTFNLFELDQGTDT